VSALGDLDVKTCGGIQDSTGAKGFRGEKAIEGILEKWALR